MYFTFLLLSLFAGAHLRRTAPRDQVRHLLLRQHAADSEGERHQPGAQPDHPVGQWAALHAHEQLPGDEQQEHVLLTIIGLGAH